MAARLKRSPASGVSRRIAASVACLGWLATCQAAWAADRRQDPGRHDAGHPAWTHTQASPGLHSLGQTATVIYQPAPAQVPGQPVITQVYAQREYAGQADVQTSLCWNGVNRCVAIVGRSINTDAFAGLDARAPMYLVHRVTAWRGSPRPLHVKGSVTVWFAPTSGPASGHGAGRQAPSSPAPRAP